MKHIIRLALLLFSCNLISQNSFYITDNSFYSGYPTDIVQLPDSGYIIYRSYSFGIQDQEIRRHNKIGGLIWSRKMNYSSTSDLSYKIILTSNNEILIAGRMGWDVTLMRLDLNGNLIFSKKITSGTPNINCLVECTSNNILLICGNNVWCVDKLGNLKWRKGFNDVTNAYKVNPNKYLLACSGYNKIGLLSGGDLNYVTIDSIGNVLMSKSFGTYDSEEIQSSCYDSITGRIYSTFGYFKNGFRKAWGILCTDTSGNQKWTELFDGEIIQSKITVLKNNTIFCAGLRDSTSFYYIYLLNISKDGTLTKQEYFPPTASLTSLWLESLKSTSDGGGTLLFTEGSWVPFLKIGKDLKVPSCKLTKQCNFKQRSLILDELIDNFSTKSVSGSYSNATYTIGTVANNTLTICSPTCNTNSYFASNNTRFCLGSNISISNASQNYINSTWKVNGVTSSTNTNFNYVFNSAGSNTITLVVNGMCIDSFSQVVYVDTMPNLNFNYSNKLLKYKFNSMNIKPGTSFTWNFGDGSSNNSNSNFDTIWHNYESFGTYSVCLTGTNTCGTSLICKSITITNNVQSTSFMKLYKPVAPTPGNVSGISIIQSYDNKYYMGGWDNSSGAYRPTVFYLDSGGKSIKSIALNFSLSIGAIINTIEGGVFFNKKSYGNIHYYGYVDSSCTSGHIHHYTTNSAQDIQGNVIRLKDGRFAICGGNLQGYIIVINKNGSFQFGNYYSAFRNIIAIRQAMDGNIYACGNNSTKTGIVLMKLDANLNLLWIKRINLGSSGCEVSDMQIRGNNRLYINGTSLAPTDRAFIYCADSSGSSVWSRLYEYNYQANKRMLVDRYGKIHITTAATSGESLITIDSLGNAINSWYPTSFNPEEFLYGLCNTFDGGIAIAGASYMNLTSKTQAMMLKYDSLFSLACIGTPLSLTVTPINSTISNETNFVSIYTPTITNVIYSPGYKLQDSIACLGSITTGIKDGNTSFLSYTSIHPNPTTNEVYFNCSRGIIERIEVINSLGKVVLVQDVKNYHGVIYIKNFDAGLYYLRVIDETKESTYHKMIKL